MTDSTMAGKARISPTGMKRPRRIYPMIITHISLSSPKSTMAVGPTRKREIAQQIIPKIMTILLSHLLGSFSIAIAEGI